jgi:hypothetical protein
MKIWLVNVALALLALFAPAKELFMATGILIIADFITGVYAAKKAKIPITSAGFRRTVSKMLIYNLAVGAGFLVQHSMMGDLVPVSNIVSSAIGLTELKSILENIDKIKGDSLVKGILAKLGSINESKKD